MIILPINFVYQNRIETKHTKSTKQTNNNKTKWSAYILLFAARLCSVGFYLIFIYIGCFVCILVMFISVFNSITEFVLLLIVAYSIATSWFLHSRHLPLLFLSPFLFLISLCLLQLMSLYDWELVYLWLCVLVLFTFLDIILMQLCLLIRKL